MSPSKVKTPRDFKFIYRNRERFWLKVDKFENKYYYGYVDSKPISKGITYNQYVTVHKNKVVETNIDLVYVFV